MQKHIQDIWLKAAVIGSVWASFEIVFGSFFHSLRIPFAGTFLSFFSVILLIGFSYKWEGKNLFLKAGIIAALMRSLLPTSIILGPLIGILIEAIIFQYTINIFKKNFISYSIIGVTVMFSAIIHKIISIIIIYGFDIVKILENLYFVMLKTTHIELPLESLLLLVLVSYTSLGILAAYLGMRVGISVKESNFQTQAIKDKWEVKNTIFETKNFKYKTSYIFIHLFALISILFVLEFYDVLYSIPFMIIYMFFIIKRYKNSMRRLAKPLFWGQLVFIVIMAMLLWKDRSEGLIVGFKMIMRAVIVVSALAAVSVELKNPLVKTVLYKKGYSQLYAVMGLATSAVPFIIKSLASEKRTLFNPLKVLKKSVGLSEVLYQEFQQHMIHKNTIYIISGETRSGKTTFLKEVIRILKNEAPPINIGGIIAHGIDKNNERFGFDIENIANNETVFLCSQDKIEDATKIGRFYFSNNGLEFGSKALTDDLDKTNLLVIDEIGYMELKGKGWFNAIENALEYENLTMIWVVRRRILEEVLQLWQHSNTKVIDINAYKPINIAKEIRNKIKK